MIDRRVRDDFIGLDRKIFFNNASYAPMLKSVKQKMEQYLQEVCNLRQPDKESFACLEQLREGAARLTGAHVDEVGFAFNTSCGLSLAATGMALAPGDEIILADNEFPSVVYSFKGLERKGVILRFSPSVNDNFSLDEARKLVTPRTRMLAVSFVQYFNGFRNDLQAIGGFCKEHDIFFVVDAIQGLGACPLDAHRCQIDLLACGAQKWLLSPLGSGFVFVSKNAKREVRPDATGWLGIDWHLKFTDLRHFDLEPFADARRFNLGTYPYLQLWAMAEAVRYLNDLGIENIFEHNRTLIDHLLEYIRNDDYYFVKSALEPEHRSQIISIGSPAGEELLKCLLSEGFYLVYREGGVRIAVNFYNTIDEVETLINRLKKFKKQGIARGNAP